MAIVTWLLTVFGPPRGLDGREASNFSRPDVMAEREEVVGTTSKAQPQTEDDRIHAIQDVTASTIEREIYEKLGW